jgi:cobalt-zinc-cadmium efflux system outer membrane protein
MPGRRIAISRFQVRAYCCAMPHAESVKRNILLIGVLALSTVRAQTAGQILTLDQAVQEAIAHNLDLAAERLNINVAEAREITARLRPNPVLSLSGQTLNLLGAAYTSNSPLGPNQFNIHTDFPIERGHKRGQRIALAREEKSLAELGVREVMRQVIASVQNAFVDVQQAKENLKLAQENLKSLESVVAINEARLRSGDLAQVELDRSRVAALQYRAAVQQAQLQLDQAKTQLQQLLGRKQKSADFDVAGELRRDTVLDSPAEITRLALARRPDLLANQAAQARSRADLRLQLANGKVDFSVGTEFTHQSAWGISGSSLGVYFSVPLPVFNRNQGEIVRAQREIALGAARSEAVQASIRTEVEKAYRQYVVSRQLLASIETEMLAKARSVRDTTDYSYRRGEASLVEFLDAQRAFNDAMQTFNDARANYARSLYLIDTVSAATVSGT